MIDAYNLSTPAGLENTNLVLDHDSITMNIEGKRVSLGSGALEAYGTRIAIMATWPGEFPHGDSERRNLPIVRDPQGFQVRLSKGRLLTAIRVIDNQFVPKIEDAHLGPDSLEGFKGRHGEEIRLDKIEDRGWVGGLAVGECSFFAKSSKKSQILTPCLEISMQDEDAINKSASLIGIRKTRGQVSQQGGRTFWHVMAVGARMMDIFELIRSFLTATKIRQAEDAIRRAKESGFLTKKEMREARKKNLMEELRRRPGSSTRNLGIALRIGYPYASKYLGELELEGKIYSVRAGSQGRPRLDRFIRPDP